MKQRCLLSLITTHRCMVTSPTPTTIQTSIPSLPTNTHHPQRLPYPPSPRLTSVLTALCNSRPWSRIIASLRRHFGSETTGCFVSQWVRCHCASWRTCRQSGEANPLSGAWRSSGNYRQSLGRSAWFAALKKCAKGQATVAASASAHVPTLPTTITGTAGPAIFFLPSGQFYAQWTRCPLTNWTRRGCVHLQTLLCSIRLMFLQKVIFHWPSASIHGYGTLMGCGLGATD
jgi:hypothetical protein